MPKNSVWYNSDGLVVGFGRRTTDTVTPATISDRAAERIITFKIPDLTALGTAATGGSGIYAPQVWAGAAQIPANATVQEVRITTDVAATSGGAADLLLGAYTISSSTGNLVAVDDDGFCAAADNALADFSVVGETLVLGKGSNAALIGKATVGSAAVVIAPIYVTAAFTAGALTVTVKYSQ